MLFRSEQSYRYYNEFLWPDRYADCVPMDKALELLKKGGVYNDF